MAESEFRIYAPSVFCICVDHNSGVTFTGRIYHCYNPAPIPFSGLVSIFIKMEKVFDCIGFPQASTETRSFGSRKKPETPNRKGASKHMQEAEVTSQRGDKGTFIVHVQYRQHATWQGKVVWAEKNKAQNFRSALELLKLIDSALDEGCENEE